MNGQDPDPSILSQLPSQRGQQPVGSVARGIAAATAQDRSTAEQAHVKDMTDWITRDPKVTDEQLKQFDDAWKSAYANRKPLPSSPGSMPTTAKINVPGLTQPGGGIFGGGPTQEDINEYARQALASGETPMAGMLREHPALRWYGRLGADLTPPLGILAGYMGPAMLARWGVQGLEIPGLFGTSMRTLGSGVGGALGSVGKDVYGNVMEGQNISPGQMAYDASIWGGTGAGIGGLGAEALGHLSGIPGLGILSRLRSLAGLAGSAGAATIAGGGGGGGGVPGGGPMPGGGTPPGGGGPTPGFGPLPAAGPWAWPTPPSRGTFTGQVVEPPFAEGQILGETPAGPAGPGLGPAPVQPQLGPAPQPPPPTPPGQLQPGVPGGQLPPATFTGPQTLQQPGELPSGARLGLPPAQGIQLGAGQPETPPAGLPPSGLQTPPSIPNVPTSILMRLWRGGRAPFQPTPEMAPQAPPEAPQAPPQAPAPPTTTAPAGRPPSAPVAPQSQPPVSGGPARPPIKVTGDPFAIEAPIASPQGGTATEQAAAQLQEMIKAGKMTTEQAQLMLRMMEQGHALGRMVRMP